MIIYQVRPPFVRKETVTVGTAIKLNRKSSCYITIIFGNIVKYLKSFKHPNIKNMVASRMQDTVLGSCSQKYAYRK
jgi:hypothetical protein